MVEQLLCKEGRDKLVELLCNQTDEQQTKKGGEDVVSESQALLIALSNQVNTLQDLLTHEVTTTTAINDQIKLIAYWGDKYSSAVFAENTDPSKAIALVEDE